MNNDEKRIKTTEEYIGHFSDSLLNNKQGRKKNESLIRAFEIALDTRKFEIDLYWKRANYFLVFVSVIFVGWYQVNQTLKSLSVQSSIDGISHEVNQGLTNEFFSIKLLLACLGFLVSFAWFCANRGSKFWQENWEANIHHLSNKLGLPIFELIPYEPMAWHKFDSKYPYSVSKINQIVSFIITLFWIFIIGVTLYFKMSGLPVCCILLIMLGLLGAIIFFGWVVHRFSENFAAKDINELTRSKGTKEGTLKNYRNNMCRK